MGLMAKSDMDMMPDVCISARVSPKPLALNPQRLLLQ